MKNKKDERSLKDLIKGINAVNELIQSINQLILNTVILISYLTTILIMFNLII